MSTQTLPEYRNVVLEGDKITGERLLPALPKQTIKVIEHRPGKAPIEEWVEIGGEASYISFSGDIKLTHIKLAVENSDLALRATWQLQDGYGEPGFTPSQGWDWSGIRDSSDEAIEAMYQVARRYFPDEDFLAVLGVSR